MENKRKHSRSPLTVNIRISHPDVGEIVVKTKDISDGGLFVLADPAGMPAVGEVVQGQVQGEVEDLPVVTMKIVRTGDDGLGLQFVES